jgi:Tol biopolymer transport system component
MAESSAAPGAGAAPHPERPGGGRHASIQGISQAVSSLVARIRENPARPSALEKERFGLFLLDIERGEVTKVADEPVRGLYYCSSPSWSRDGRRLVFDASPGAVFDRTHIVMIGPEGQRDLGVGACPSLSPDGGRIAFLLNPGAVPDGEWERGVWPPGVYVMRADGTDRRRIGHHGRPKWSPDGGNILICDFSKPCRVMLLGGNGSARTLAGLDAYTPPDWAGEDTIVAAVRRDPAGQDADTVALFDVSDSGLARMKEVLWRKGQGLDVVPSYPVYSPAARRCVFAGTDSMGMAIYGLDRDRDQARPVMLEPGQFDRTIQDLALSPDGRYVVFASDRNARPLRPAPPGGLGSPPTP